MLFLSLFLHIRNNVETKSGCSFFCGRQYAGVGPISDEAFKEFQRNTFYSAMTLPFLPYTFPLKGKAEKVVFKVLTDSLKKSNEVVKFVLGVL